MSLSLLTYPANTVSVTNEMLFVLSETVKANDPVNYPNYRYVCDVYVTGNLVARLKVNPDPVNYLGVFDVSKVLRNYVPAYSFYADYSVLHYSYDQRLEYQLKFGEEYNETIYLDLLTDSEREAFRTYVKGAYTSTEVMNIGTKYLLSNAPGEIQGNKDIKFNYFNFISNATGTIEWGIKDEGGSTIDSGSDTYMTAYNISQYNFSFKKLSTGWPQNDINDAAYMIILFDAVELLRINYKCSKYTPVLLAWLNQYGVYETYSFDLVSKKSVEIERKEYRSLHYNIDASGVVTYDTNGVLIGSNKTYGAKTKETMSIQSNLLSAGEYTWLADLVSSSQVFVYIDELSLFAPCKITDNNYEYRNYQNSRLTNLQLRIEFSKEYNSQFL